MDLTMVSAKKLFFSVFWMAGVKEKIARITRLHKQRLHAGQAPRKPTTQLLATSGLDVGLPEGANGQF